MITDLMELFKLNSQLLNEDAKEYRWRNGLYIRIKQNKTILEQLNDIESQMFKVQNNKVDESDLIEKKDLINWIYDKDVKSRVMKDDGNKTLDVPKKKYYSTHVLAIGMKKESFLESDIKSHLTKYIWDKYVTKDEIESSFLKSEGLFSFEKSKKERMKFYSTVFADIKNYLDNPLRDKTLGSVVSYWQKEWNHIIERLVSQATDKAYLFLYIDMEDTELAHTYKGKSLYEWEYEWYSQQRLFPVNKYNKLINGDITGIPVLDYTLNSKKPFLKELTRMEGISHYVTLDEAAMQEKMIKYFEGKKKDSGKFDYDGVKTDHNPGITYVYKGGMEKTIEYYDNAGRITDRKPKIIQVTNFLNYRFMEKRTLKDKSEIEKSVQSLFFNFSPTFRLEWLESDNNEIKKRFDKNMAGEQAFRQGKNIFHDYFNKDDERYISNYLSKVSIPLLEKKLSTFYQSRKIDDQKHVYEFASFLHALKLHHKNRSSVDMQKMVDKDFYIRANNEQITIDTPEEFYYYAGQIAYYLVSLSKAKDKNFSMLDTLMRVSKPEHVKKKLENLFFSYSHEINISHAKFKDVYKKILSFSFDSSRKISNSEKEALILGLMVDNVFYTKKVEKQEELANA